MKYNKYKQIHQTMKKKGKKGGLYSGRVEEGIQRWGGGERVFESRNDILITKEKVQTDSKMKM